MCLIKRQLPSPRSHRNLIYSRSYNPKYTVQKNLGYAVDEGTQFRKF